METETVHVPPGRTHRGRWALVALAPTTWQPIWLPIDHTHGGGQVFCFGLPPVFGNRCVSIGGDRVRAVTYLN